MTYRRKNKQKNYGVCFHAEENGMCTGKKNAKNKHTQNAQNYKLQNLQNLFLDK